MLTQKIDGCSEGSFITIGDTIFAIVPNGTALHKEAQTATGSITYHDCYNYIADKYGVTQVNRDNHKYVSVLECYGFKEHNKPWVVSENTNGNYTGDQIIGRAITAVESDKKKRIKRDKFLTLYKYAYLSALHEEINNLVI